MTCYLCSVRPAAAESHGIPMCRDCYRANVTDEDPTNPAIRVPVSDGDVDATTADCRDFTVSW